MSGIGAAMLGLLGLLLRFTLSVAIARWDLRHNVIVNESNAIGTLALRAEVLDQSLRDEMRAALREYVEARIALGRLLLAEHRDTDAVKELAELLTVLDAPREPNPPEPRE